MKLTCIRFVVSTAWTWSAACAAPGTLRGLHSENELEIVTGTVNNIGFGVDGRLYIHGSNTNDGIQGSVSTGTASVQNVEANNERFVADQFISIYDPGDENVSIQGGSSGTVGGLFIPPPDQANNENSSSEGDSDGDSSSSDSSRE